MNHYNSHIEMIGDQIGAGDLQRDGIPVCGVNTRSNFLRNYLSYYSAGIRDQV
jgi:hypothetical protein